MRLTGVDIIVETLIEQKVDRVFGCLDCQILNVYYSYIGHISTKATSRDEGAVLN